MQLKTSEEIAIIARNCRIVNDAMAQAIATLKIGTTTRQIDTQIEKYIRSHGAEPSFKGYMKYPFATCISVNDAVVHGFPTDRALQAGDVVSIDVGAFKDGFHSDSAYTILLASASDTSAIAQLMRTAQNALTAGIACAVAGKRVGDIGNAVQEVIERGGRYGIVRDLVGHGLGRKLHEPPNVPNYGKRGRGMLLSENLVIAIEPMINLGTEKVFIDKDDWTVRTRDGRVSVHFEHAVAVGRNAAQLLSSFASIEEAVRSNPALVWVDKNE